jgi:hypothetical protein
MNSAVGTSLAPDERAPLERYGEELRTRLGGV